MGKTTIDILGALLTIYIFTMLVVSTFLKIYNPLQEMNITLKYYFLIGFYGLLYCFIYFKNINNLTLNRLLITNLFFVSVFIIYVSFIEKLSTFDLRVQFIFNILSMVWMIFTFIIFPLIIGFIAVYFGISKKHLK